MAEEPTQGWVWISSEASRAAGRVSVVAVAETLICVALYWLLILYWGVTWHHWMIVVATPLVLMRSRASTSKGVRWFSAFEDSAESKKENSICKWRISIFPLLC